VKVGVFKFSSCDGCQLAFFELEEELIEFAKRFSIEYFLEASSQNRWEHFHVAFVEGSVSTPEEEERIVKIRESSDYLVALGACAVSGGIQSARNFQDFNSVFSYVYEKPLSYGVNPLSRPLADYVKVDLEIRGCPVSKQALREVLLSLLYDKSPELPTWSVCLDCKRRGNVCVMVAYQEPCLGPVTMAGCNALCPTYKRGCYGCYGPVERPNLEALFEAFQRLGLREEGIREKLLLSFNAFNPHWRQAL